MEKTAKNLKLKTHFSVRTKNIPKNEIKEIESTIKFIRKDNQLLIRI